MSLKPLWLVNTAREDVLQGGLSDNHFAAQLDKIVREPGSYPLYGDPEDFFSLTYPTSGLRTLLTKVFGRVSGASGVAGENGVLRSETSFGGGKTHGLVAVYHLAKGARPGNLADFVDSKLLPANPVRIAAIVGDALDPSAGLETNGVRTFTIWGEMGAQIGPAAVEALDANERDRTAPSTHTIRAALAGQPAIVIIDEIAQHLRQAIKSGNEDVRRYAGAIPVFLKNLFEVGGDPTNHVSVVVTLASAKNAFGKESNEISELLDETSEATRAAVSEVQDVLTRMVQPGAVITPAQDAEIGEILKTRLFESIDTHAAAAAGVAYRGLYEGLIKDQEQLAGGAEHPTSYAALVERMYPFHPELVRVLDKRLGAIPKFQRARGALKLLAEVVAHIYRDEDSSPVINVADIDYSDEPVRYHLTMGLERPEFSRVAEVDLAGPSSHAASVDARVFPDREPYATRVCRTVFTHSLEMTVSAGAGRTEWILGTMQPGDTTALLERALAESERVCWHLSSDGARWRFHVEPNVNAILEEEKANVQNTRVAQILDDLVVKAFPNDGGAATVHYPAGPATVADTSILRLAVMHPDQITMRGKNADDPPELLVDILDHTGQSQAPRKYRNGVVFVVADDDHYETLKDKVRALIAADTIAGDPQRMTQFSADVQKKIESYQKNTRLEGRVAITRCFKHIYMPVNDRSHHHLRHLDLPAQQQGDTKSATSVVLQLLEDEGKIRKDKLSYEWLKSKAWPPIKVSISTSELADWFWIDHGSPIIRNPALIRDAIVDGIKNDDWVYYDAAMGKAWTGTSMAGMSVEFRADTDLMQLGEAIKRGLLVRKPTVGDLKGLPTTNVTNGSGVRAHLEAKCGGEPSKGDVLEVLATEVSNRNYQSWVVTDTEPAEGVTALTPTQIRDKGLDGLNVMQRAVADSLGVRAPTRTTTKKLLTASGSSGPALTQIVAKTADLTGRRIARLTIQATADDVKGSQDIDLLVSSLGMLQRHDITVHTDLAAEFIQIDGGISVDAQAARKAYQTLNTTLSKVLAAASKVSGTVRLDIRFTEPVASDDPAFTQLVTVFKTLNLTETTVTAEMAS